MKTKTAYKALITATFIMLSYWGKAQDEVTIYDDPEAFRPKIHFSSKQDWMSDPNGLV